MENTPPLKTDPKYGYFPWWPQDGNDWLHPDDVAIARSMIPSNRMFRRDGTRRRILVTALRRRHSCACGRRSGKKCYPKASKLAIGSRSSAAACATNRAPASSAKCCGTNGQRAIRYQIFRKRRSRSPISMRAKTCSTSNRYESRVTLPTRAQRTTRGNRAELYELSVANDQ